MLGCFLLLGVLGEVGGSLLWFRILKPEPLKDKLRYIKNFKSKNRMEFGNIKPEVVRNAPLTGAGERHYTEKVETK